MGILRPSLQKGAPPASARLGSWGIAVTNPNVDDFTVPEKILLAAEQLEQQGQTPFTAEMLTVAVWKRFPATFGLKGFVEAHADNNEVLSSLMGEKGLARRGWLQKTEKMYTLTREGRRMIRRITLQEGDEPEAAALQKLPRELASFLENLFESSASQKFDTNRKADVGFSDACRFWNITENMRGDQLDERLEIVRKNLTTLDRTLAEGDIVLSSGRVVTAGEVRVLTNIHRFMEDKFERHLNLMRSRAGKR
jgi:hypothetical protein